MPADPAAVPPPSWAVEIAKTVGDCGAYHDFDGACCVEIVNRIARLLASVREGALREAAGVALGVMEGYKSMRCVHRKARMSFPWPVVMWGAPEKLRGAEFDGAGVGALRCNRAILSPLHTPPSGGAG